MKILIIGASGMLAKPVIKELAGDGHQLKLFSRTIKNDNLNENCEIYKGDLFHPVDLQEAMEGCEAVHINLSKVNESSAVNRIVGFAMKNRIKLITYISGCTVLEENRWFPLVDNKYNAERAIITCGIDYVIFRPAWFFETLPLMIRNGKAMMFGKLLYPSRWIAAKDYAQMVVKAYKIPDAKNKSFNVYGKQFYYMKDLLYEYCQNIHPEIKKITVIPIWLANTIAILTRNKILKGAAELFSYFEKVKETGDSIETYKILGEPEINFNKWLELQKEMKNFKK